MAYRDAWEALVLGGRSILDVALDVHMAITGASELDPKMMPLDHLLLRNVVNKWQPTSNPRSERFDAAVKEVVLAAIAEADKWEQDRHK